LIASSVVGVTQVGTDGAQYPSVENVFACQCPPGRATYKPSPWSAFVPAFVTMFNAGPDVQPNSDENAFESTAISCTAPTGTVASIV
jgi:hypothetical protein